MEECFDIAKRKNNDYGDDGILKFGIKGTVIRMNDKIDRLSNLVFKGKEAEVKDEKIEDTLLDLVNYAIYSVMLVRNNFKSSPEEN